MKNKILVLPIFFMFLFASMNPVSASFSQLEVISDSDKNWEFSFEQSIDNTEEGIQKKKNCDVIKTHHTKKSVKLFIGTISRREDILNNDIPLKQLFITIDILQTKAYPQKSLSIVLFNKSLLNSKNKKLNTWNCDIGYRNKEIVQRNLSTKIALFNSQQTQKKEPRIHPMYIILTGILAALSLIITFMIYKKRNGE